MIISEVLQHLSDLSNNVRFGRKHSILISCLSAVSFFLLTGLLTFISCNSSRVRILYLHVTSTRTGRDVRVIRSLPTADFFVCLPVYNYTVHNLITSV